jgi:sporulation protein YlmC with PRC-barrel domain
MAPASDPASDMAAAPAPVEPAPASDMAAAPADPAAPAADTDMTAQTDTAAPAADTTQMSDTATTDTTASEGFLTANADQIRASTLIGQSIYSAEDESIGEVSDLILQEDETRVALIDVGGFLGIGENTVAIPFEQLNVAANENGEVRVTAALSREQLEQMPVYEAPDTRSADATDPTVPADQPADTMAAAPADGTAPAEQPTGDMAAAPATTDPLATDDVTTGSIATDYTVATQDIPASDLMGTTVYGSDDATLGEVSDIVFAQNGDIEAVVLDVGGFLGIGEKPVAFQFDQLNVRRDENGSLMVMINANADQLNQAPAYEMEAGTTTVQ